MTTKITEKTEIEIKDLSKVEDDLKPHFSKIVRAVKYFDSKFIKITSNIEQIGDNTYINFDVEDVTIKKKK